MEKTRNNVSCVNFTKSVYRLINKCSKGFQKLTKHGVFTYATDCYREGTFLRLKQSKVTS